MFIPRLPAEYAIWMGHIDTPDEVKAMYDVDEVKFISCLQHSSPLLPPRLPRLRLPQSVVVHPLTCSWVLLWLWLCLLRDRTATS